VEALEARQDKLEERNEELRAANKKLNVRILTQKEVDELPVPVKTLGGDYKVPQNTYRNLLATAKRVGRVDSREKKLDSREKQLKAEEEAFEQRQRLPMKEKMELATLRVMRRVVEKVIDILPEGFIRQALIEAMQGRDLFREQERARTRVRHMDRDVI